MTEKAASLLEYDSLLSAAVIRSILLGSRSEWPSYCTFFFSLLKFVVNLKTKTKGLGKDNDFVAFAQNKDAISSALRKQGPISEATNAQSFISGLFILRDTSVIFTPTPKTELLET